MKRGLKLSLLLASILVALLLGGRSMQNDFSPTEQVGDTGFVRVRNAYVDVYAKRVGSRVLVFDTGMDPKSAPVKEALPALGAEPADVSHLFLTYGHFDHINGVDGLPPEATPTEIIVGFEDTGPLNGARPNPRLLPRLAAMLLETRHFGVTAGLRGARRVPVSSDATVLALPVPGHTAGSYVYLLDGVLIAGDAMNFHDGRLEPAPASVSEDPALVLRSIAALRGVLQAHPVRVVCTGHGGCTPEADTQRLLEELFRATQPAVPAPPPQGA